MLSRIMTSNIMAQPYTLIGACKPALLAVAIAAISATKVAAHEASGGRADSHAPIGVMGDHVHKAGEFMVSFRHMQMSMSGNIMGSDDISDDDIATTIPNRFAGMPNMPATLRIVPQEMTSSMNMLGLMYAPSDKVTLMAMLNYIDKDMRLKTYSGGMGTDVRGYFETSTSGLGDTKLAALVSLHQSSTHKLHLNLGLSLPTGDIKQRGDVLPPMDMGGMDMGMMGSDMDMDSMATMNMRLPYAMQLGSGTYDIEPGITYSGMGEQVSWGAQLKALVRSGENSEGYTLGDQQALTAWGQYLFQPALSASLRLNARHTDDIDGLDSEIMGPVQTADPSHYGGEFVDLGIGVNYYGQSGFLNKQRFAIEYSVPVLQDVNGVQMSMDSMLTLGYQYAF